MLSQVQTYEINDDSEITIDLENLNLVTFSLNVMTLHFNSGQIYEVNTDIKIYKNLITAWKKFKSDLYSLYSEDFI